MKIKNNFGRTKRGRKLKKHLDALIECQDNTYDEMSKIEEQHLDISDNDEPERYISNLPIECLEDSCKFASKKNIRNRLSDFRKRTELRKRWDKKGEQIDKLDEAIYLAEIEFTIANINYLIEKTENL